MALKQKLQKFHDRPLSWSSINSFLYNRKKWYAKYIEDYEEPKTPELEFGSKVGKLLETDTTFLPQIVRESKMEYQFEFTIPGTNIKCIGYGDTFCEITLKKLGEYKTGVKIWDQKRVDEHGQLTMYTLGNYIQNNVKPEDVDIVLWWMPTDKTEDENFNSTIDFVPDIENNIKMFKTKRTTVQALQFASIIKSTYVLMENYIKNHD